MNEVKAMREAQAITVKEKKRAKREEKKALRKAQALTKTRMEVVRTLGSAGSFILGTLAFLRAYNFI